MLCRIPQLLADLADAVFFSSYCGISERRTDTSGKLVQASAGEECDMRCLSVREAVNFAKQTNLLGVILEATTLVSVRVSHSHTPWLISRLLCHRSWHRSRTLGCSWPRSATHPTWQLCGQARPTAGPSMHLLSTGKSLAGGAVFKLADLYRVMTLSI